MLVLSASVGDKTAYSLKELIRHRSAMNQGREVEVSVKLLLSMESPGEQQKKGATRGWGERAPVSRRPVVKDDSFC